MNIFSTDSIAARIDRVAEYDFSSNKVFGSAYLVSHQGVEIERCYGSAALHSNAPVTNHTVFRLASMTKPITAVAALILIERGLLSLDDTVDRFFPQFKEIQIINASQPPSVPRQMPTIRSILTHTSGIGSDHKKIAAMTQADLETIDSVIAYFLKNGLDFEPHTAQCYSGFAAFDVLTKIIETVAQTDYQSFLQTEIFAPCDMYDTTFTPNADQRSRMIEMHTKTNEKNDTFAMTDGCIFENIPQSHFLGGAGLVSTLHDYARFAELLLGKGTIRGHRILQEASVALLSTPHVSKAIMPGKERWGLGVRVITEDTYPYLPKGCFGWSGAYGSHFWIDPVNDIYAVMMKNSRFDGGAANESARNFEKAVYSDTL